MNNNQVKFKYILVIGILDISHKIARKWLL